MWMNCGLCERWPQVRMEILTCVFIVPLVPTIKTSSFLQNSFKKSKLSYVTKVLELKQKEGYGGGNRSNCVSIQFRRSQSQFRADSFHGGQFLPLFNNSLFMETGQEGTTYWTKKLFISSSIVKAFPFLSTIFINYLLKILINVF